MAANNNVMGNAWDQVVIFNQCVLRNVLAGCEDLGTPELQAAIAMLTQEQKDNMILFLGSETVWLAELLEMRGPLAIANNKVLLDYLPHIEPNAGAIPHGRGGVDPAENEVASSMLPKFMNFSGQVKESFKFIEEFKMKAVGMAENKKIATIIALGWIVTASWFKQDNFLSWEALETAFKKT